MCIMFAAAVNLFITCASVMKSSDLIRADFKLILKEACRLGISVKQGSADRAWIKAAHLFIDCYVLSVAQEEKLIGLYKN